MIKVVRSWPDNPPKNHAYVQDSIERVIIDNFDYTPLAGLHADMIHLDWDTAVAPHMLQTFAGYAYKARDRVIVAPQMMYPGSLNGSLPRNFLSPQWNVYKHTGKAPWSRECTTNDLMCDWCGFGMIYLPWERLNQFLTEQPEKCMDDYNFTCWYSENVCPIPVCWDVENVHVNQRTIKDV